MSWWQTRCMSRIAQDLGIITFRPSVYRIGLSPNAAQSSTMRQVAISAYRFIRRASGSLHAATRHEDQTMSGHVSIYTANNYHAGASHAKPTSCIATSQSRSLHSYHRHGNSKGLSGTLIHREGKRKTSTPHHNFVPRVCVSA